MYINTVYVMLKIRYATTSGGVVYHLRGRAQEIAERSPHNSLLKNDSLCTPMPQYIEHLTYIILHVYTVVLPPVKN